MDARRRGEQRVCVSACLRMPMRWMRALQSELCVCVSVCLCPRASHTHTLHAAHMHITPMLYGWMHATAE
eukprot:10385105-Alexandrium_andersonii.AAC.1